MNPELKLFSNPENLRRLDRCHLTRLLEEHQDCLAREAVALLFANPPPDHENWCSAWAAQFKSPAAFGAPLRNALLDIETLSLPENRTLLEHALSNLPAHFEVNRGFPPLHQALHLWLIAQNTPGVTFPIRASVDSAPCHLLSPGETASLSDEPTIEEPSALNS
jgi:hypothetical protein